MVMKSEFRQPFTETSSQKMNPDIHLSETEVYRDTERTD